MVNFSRRKTRQVLPFVFAIWFWGLSIRSVWFHNLFDEKVHYSLVCWTCFLKSLQETVIFHGILLEINGLIYLKKNSECEKDKCHQIKMLYLEQSTFNNTEASDHHGDMLNKYETRRGLNLYIACDGKRVNNNNNIFGQVAYISFSRLYITMNGCYGCTELLLWVLSLQNLSNLRESR